MMVRSSDKLLDYKPLKFMEYIQQEKDIVGDVNHDGKKDIGDLNNPTYKQTKAFLDRLKEAQLGAT